MTSEAKPRKRAAKAAPKTSNLTEEQIRLAVRHGVLRYLQAKYQAIETAREGVRPLPPREHGPEEERQLTDLDRLQAIAIDRNLQRSNSKALAIIQNRVVLGFGVVKAHFAARSEKSPEEAEAWNAAAEEFFNVDFARDARWDEPEHFTEIVQGIERALMLEGDLLVAIDDGWLGDSGKLILWESDQLAELSEADWRANAPKWARTKAGEPFRQAHGVITSPEGRLAGFVACRRSFAAEKAGSIQIPWDQATVIPADSARLIKNRWRFNQVRGVPSMLPVSDNLYDIDEMVKSELSSARVKAKLYAMVRHTEKEPLNTDQQALAADIFQQLKAADTGVASAAPAEGGDGSAAVTDASGAPVLKLPKYDNLEAAVGGMTDYLAPGDTVEFPDMDRPNVDVATFFNELGDAAGASQGLTQGFTRMAVSSSYTAHRGETAITYSHLRNYRKRMEHQLLDFVAEKVIRRAVRLGFIPFPPDPRWMFRICWEFPAADPIDPEKQARADAQKLKTGTTTFSELLGPGWRAKMRELSAEAEYARALGLPLSFFDTVAGAPASSENNSTEE